MKLSAAILAAFVSTSGKLTSKCNQNYMIILEANVSCSNGKQLFEATCDSNGFVIKINQEGTTIFLIGPKKPIPGNLVIPDLRHVVQKVFLESIFQIRLFGAIVR